MPLSGHASSINCNEILWLEVGRARPSHQCWSCSFTWNSDVHTSVGQDGDTHPPQCQCVQTHWPQTTSHGDVWPTYNPEPHSCSKGAVEHFSNIVESDNSQSQPIPVRLASPHHHHHRCHSSWPRNSSQIIAASHWSFGRIRRTVKHESVSLR